MHIFFPTASNKYSYNNKLPSGKIEDNVITYYNYQEPPIINDITYNTTTDEIDINWSATTIPSGANYYDISFSHLTIPDISYNYNVKGIKIIEPSNNGINYYPGEYNVRVRAAYGSNVPTDDISSIFSEWSVGSSLNKIPYHKPKNGKIYQSGETIKLEWDRIQETKQSFKIPTYLIPEDYSINKKQTHIDGTDTATSYNDIPRTDSSFNDIDISDNCVFEYDVSANYKNN